MRISRHIGVLTTLALCAGFAGQASAMIVYYKQQHYRWRNDDGDESTATWRAGVDTPVSGVSRDKNLRVRFCIAAYDGNKGDYLDMRTGLKYSTSSSGPWTDVPVSGALHPFVIVASTNFAGQSHTTDQLSGTGTFTGTGRMLEAPDSLTDPSTLVVGEYLNNEVCFRPTAKARGGTTYYLTSFGNSDDVEARLTMAAGEAEEPPAIVNSITITGKVGIAFDSGPIYATGSEPITYTANGLPAGLSMDGARSIIGIPEEGGTFSVDVVAANAYGADTNTVEMVIAAPETDMVIDNWGPLPPGASRQALGKWTVSTESTGCWSDNSVFGVQSSVSELSYSIFVWRYNMPENAHYDVYAWWTHAPLRSDRVPYGVTHADGTSTVLANQSDTNMAGRWVWLGKFRFETGENSGQVQCQAKYGQASADAVRFVRSDGYADSDGDGMDDSWEMTYFGSLDHPDGDPGDNPDGDGMTNLEEAQAGTNPNDPNSQLEITGAVVPNGTEFTLEWTSAAGKTYSIQRKINLSDPAWLVRDSGIAATAPTNTYVDTVTSDTAFYRILVEP